jgi:hypothetical protein
LSVLRCAIIEALRCETTREQFVIAYRNEQLLREFIPCTLHSRNWFFVSRRSSRACEGSH